MNGKVMSRLCFLISILLLLPWAIPAAKAVSAEKIEADGYFNDIVSFVCKETSANDTVDFVENILPTGAAGIYDWYAFALIRSNENLDFTAYKNALLKNAKENTLAGAVERERFALLTAALNTDTEFVNNTLDTCTGQLGIMSYIYALHIMNNGYASEKYSEDTVISQLLELRSQNAGWSLTGKGSDIDVTAMVIQCLAPHYSTSGEVGTAVDEALNWISSQQTQQGGFIGYGTENSESCSQVIIALCSMGISPYSDTRFIKNGRTAVDALLSYRLADGSFAHITETGYNAKATEQALLAFLSLDNLKKDNTPLYIFATQTNTADKTEPATVQTEESTLRENTYTEEAENAATVSDAISESTETATEKASVYEPADTGTVNTGTAESPVFSMIKTLSSVRNILLIISGILAAVFITVGVILAKKRKKSSNIFFIITALLLAVCAFLSSDIKSADEYYSVTELSAGTDTVTVTFSINCDTVKSHSSEKEYIPEDGIILPETEITLEAGSTVYDCLVYAAKKYGIQMENDAQAGSGNSTAYISGLNYLYEFDYGELSGWMYFVNGKSASVGCGEQILNDGDSIVWKYTCNSGDDLI